MVNSAWPMSRPPTMQGWAPGQIDIAAIELRNDLGRSHAQQRRQAGEQGQRQQYAKHQHPALPKSDPGPRAALYLQRRKSRGPPLSVKVSVSPDTVKLKSYGVALPSAVHSEASFHSPPPPSIDFERAVALVLVVAVPWR